MITYMTFLMVKSDTGSTYEKVSDIITAPKIGGDPEMLDRTSLSEGMTTHELGIQQTDSMPFEMLYDKEVYKKLVAMEGVKKSWAIWYGGTEEDGVVTPTGTDGAWEFDGAGSVQVHEANVNEIRKMTWTIAASTVPKFKDIT